MQVIYPNLERLEKKAKRLKGKKHQKAREKILLATWKHKGIPGYAQF